MSAQTLWVGTRKGLFAVRQIAGDWRIGRPHFPGEPVTQFLADPPPARGMRRCAWATSASSSGRASMAARAGAKSLRPRFRPSPPTGRGSDDPTPWSVDLVWGLEAAPDGRLWAGCLPAGLFTSADGGASWQLVESLWNRPERKEWFGGGYDHAGIHSILLDPRDSSHVTVAISCGGVWQTRDGGASWTNTSAGMVAEFMPPERREDPNIQDPHRIDQCLAHPDVLWCQHHGGIFRSVDGGLTVAAGGASAAQRFRLRRGGAPDGPAARLVRAGAFGRPAHGAGRAHGRDGNARRRRDVPVFARRGCRSSDAYHLIYRHALAASADGQTLAMGSTTGGLWLSEDAGAELALPVARPAADRGAALRLNRRLRPNPRTSSRRPRRRRRRCPARGAARSGRWPGPWN